MTKPTSYDLLKEIYSEVSSLRSEMTAKIEKIEERVGKLEQIGAKVAIMWGVVTALSTAAFTYIWERVINKS